MIVAEDSAHRSSGPHSNNAAGGGRGGVSQSVSSSVVAMSEWPTLGEVVAEEPMNGSSSGATSSNGSSVTSPKVTSGRESRRGEKNSERLDRGGDRGNGDHDNVTGYDSSQRTASGGPVKGYQGSGHGASQSHGNVANSTANPNSPNSHNGGSNSGAAGGNNSNSYAINKKKGELLL